MLSACCLLTCCLNFREMGGVVVAAGTCTALTAISSLGKALAVQLQASDFGTAAAFFLLVLFQRRWSVCLRQFGIEHRRIVLGRRGRVVEKHIKEVSGKSGLPVLAFEVLRSENGAVLEGSQVFCAAHFTSILIG